MYSLQAYDKHASSLVLSPFHDSTPSTLDCPPRYASRDTEFKTVSRLSFSLSVAQGVSAQTLSPATTGPISALLASKFAKETNGSYASFRSSPSNAHESISAGSQGPCTYGSISYEVCEAGDMSELTIDQTGFHVRTVTSAQLSSPTKLSEAFATAEGSTVTETFNTVQTCTDTEFETVTVCPPSTDYNDARKFECPPSVVEVPVEVLPPPVVEGIVVPIEVSPLPLFPQSPLGSRTMISWKPEITELTSPPSQRISVAATTSILDRVSHSRAYSIDAQSIYPGRLNTRTLYFSQYSLAGIRWRPSQQHSQPSPICRCRPRTKRRAIPEPPSSTGYGSAAAVEIILFRAASTRVRLQRRASLKQRASRPVGRTLAQFASHDVPTSPNINHTRLVPHTHGPNSSRPRSASESL